MYCSLVLIHLLRVFGCDWQVSLAAIDQTSTSEFPLSSLGVECSQQFGVDWEGKNDDRAGNYFVLATAFPSTKV